VGAVSSFFASEAAGTLLELSACGSFDSIVAAGFDVDCDCRTLLELGACGSFDSIVAAGFDVDCDCTLVCFTLNIFLNQFVVASQL